MDTFYYFLLLGIIILVIFSLKKTEHFGFFDKIVHTISHPVDAIEDVGRAYVNTVDSAINSIAALENKIIPGLGDDLNPLEAVSKLKEKLSSAADKIKDAGEDVLQLGTKLEQGLVKGATDLANDIKVVEKKIEDGIVKAEKEIVELANEVPDLAKKAIDGIIQPIKTLFKDAENIGIEIIDGGKNLVLTIPNSFENLIKHLEPFFNALKDFFGQIEFFVKLVIILMKRTTNCILGGSKAMELYFKDCLDKYIAVTKSLANFSNCGISNWKIYSQCWIPVKPAKDAIYDFFISLKKWWEEILVLPEMVPQGANLDWCDKNFKGITNTTDALAYAEKCNECLYIKGVMAIGVAEIEDIGKVLEELLTITIKISDEFIAIGPALTKGVSELESDIVSAFSKIPLL